MSATNDISPIMSRSDEFASTTIAQGPHNSNAHTTPCPSPLALCENTLPRFSPVPHTYAKNSRPMRRVNRTGGFGGGGSNDFDDADTVTSVDTSFRRILLESNSIDDNHSTAGTTPVPTVSSGATFESALTLDSGSASLSSFTEKHDQNDVDEEPEPHVSQSEDEERRLREEAESEELARALMAEEAMASYNQSAAFLHDNADQYSAEDLAALRAIMEEESPLVIAAEEDIEEGAELEMDSEELSYDALLNLGERIGDVKQERWALRAKDEIAKLECKSFCHDMAKDKDENDSGRMCLVCQFAYEENEEICILPCKHYFHKECISQWLMAKDFCPYCRQCITEES